MFETSNNIKKTLINQISKLDDHQQPEADGLSIEGVRLFSLLERSDQRLDRQHFDVYIVKLEELDDFLKQLKNPDILPLSGTRRLQVIVKIEDHFITIDLKFSAEKKEAILLDAANDLRYQRALEILEDHVGKIYLGFGRIDPMKGPLNLQRDYISCPVFALDHAAQISQIDLYDRLSTISEKIEAKIDLVYWEDFPPSIVWNAQSLSWLKYYETKHATELDKVAANGLSYIEYLKLGIEKIEGEVRNHSIERLFENYRKKSLAFIEETDESKLSEICYPDNKIKPISLRDDLKAYIENKEKVLEKAGGQYSLSGVISYMGSMFGGWSKTTDLALAKKLLAVLEGGAILSFTNDEKLAIQQSEIAPIIDRHKDDEAIQMIKSVSKPISFGKKG